MVCATSNRNLTPVKFVFMDNISGKTIALHDSQTKEYVGRYSCYRNTWALIGEVANRATAPAALRKVAGVHEARKRTRGRHEHLVGDP